MIAASMLRTGSVFANLVLLLSILMAPFETGAAQPGVAEYSLWRLESRDEGPVVLVVGGIQGDEPGGFHAATLLATRYEVLRGRVWVIPNLNFHSILRRHRGIHGDLNRKFAALERSDPEYALVRSIQALITSPSVSTVLNLHDGSGFYRPVYEDAERNPQRWGQTLVIDAPDYRLDDGSSLFDWALRLVEIGNRRLPDALHLRVKDTRTDAGNAEMQKALTWFALSSGKAALASEASKSLGTVARVMTHLASIEALLVASGVEFRRDFELSETAVRAAINSGLVIRLDRGRVCLELDRIRPVLRRLPLGRSPRTQFQGNNPLLAVRRGSSGEEIRYGNRRLLRFDWFDAGVAEWAPVFAEHGAGRIEVRPCTELSVNGGVRLRVAPGYRVNAIGAGGAMDQDRMLHQADFDPAYSLDRDRRVFRLEYYRGSEFAGMSTLRFVGPVDPAPGLRSLWTAPDNRRTNPPRQESTP